MAYANKLIDRVKRILIGQSSLKLQCIFLGQSKLKLT